MKYIFGFLFGIASLMLGIAVWQYLFCPQLDFKTTSAFSGRNWYDPYDSLPANDWVKCNFHAHTKDWGGVTCGNGTAKDLYNVYANLHYRVHCISEYQKINKEYAKDSNYVPAYEHGYNLMKTHQLVIGDNTVTWADFLLPQTRSNKQWILSHLSSSPKDIVVLNHPIVRGAYSPEDMNYLTGFQCIEVLNPNARSFSVWDAALSDGKPIFITANDDLHYVLDRWDSGRFCTWLNVEKANKESVVKALKSGKGYGMEVGFIPHEDATTRRKRIRDKLPYLKSCEIQHDSLVVEFSKPACQIQFVGQGGKVLQQNEQTEKAYYSLKDNDTYVRTAVVFSDSAKIYLNPVYRYTTHPLTNAGGFTINKTKTLLARTLGIIILMGWFLLFIRVAFGFQIFRRSGLEPAVEEQPEPVVVEV